MPLIYSNRVYTLIFALAFLAWVASELLGPARWQGSPGAQRRDRGSTVVLALSAGVGVVFFFAFPLIAPTTTISTVQQFPFFGVGMAIVLLGTGLRWLAIRTLGRNFSGSVVLEEAEQLVRHGPYKRIRHPSYTGILLVAVGFGLMMGNWASILAISTGMLVGLLYRISIEEAALCQYFGPAYREYMAGTKRLIPFVF